MAFWIHEQTQFMEAPWSVARNATCDVDLQFFGRQGFGIFNVPGRLEQVVHRCWPDLLLTPQEESIH